MKKYLTSKAWLIPIFMLLSNFFLCQISARLIRDIPSSELEYLQRAITLLDENPRYKRLGSIWEEKVGKDSKLKKISFMVDILNILQDLAPFSYREAVEKKIKEEYPHLWSELATDQYTIETHPERKLGIILNWLWEWLNDEEKDIFRAAGLVLETNPKQLLYEYITQVNFNFILTSIYGLSSLSIKDISFQLNSSFIQEDQVILREITLKIAKFFFRQGFNIEELLPLAVDLSSKNSQEKVFEFEENLAYLYNTILQFDEISLEAQPVLSSLLYHTKEGHLELSPSLFRNTYLDRISGFILSLKDIYSIDLMNVCLDTAFNFSLRDALEFYDNLMSLEYFILELKREFPFSLDSFKDILLKISKTTKNFPLRSNVFAVQRICESLNEIKLNPNKNVLGLVEIALNISFENENIFRSHMETIKIFLNELIGWGDELKYYLKKWIPQFAEEAKGFVEEGKIEKEDIQQFYRNNFVLSLKNFLILLDERNIYAQSVAGDIIHKSFELAEEPEDFSENIKFAEFLIRALTLRYPATPSFLRYLIDKSFDLSYGITENYRLNQNTLEFLIEKLNLAEIPSTRVIKQLIHAAELSMRNSSKIFRGNIAVIQQFVEDLTSYKEKLQAEGIVLELVLSNVVPEIAKEVGDDYLKFRQELRYLKERLIGS